MSAADIPSPLLFGDRSTFGIELTLQPAAGSWIMAVVTLHVGGSTLGRQDDPVMLGLVLDALEGLVRSASREPAPELFGLGEAEAWLRLRGPEGATFRVPSTEFFDDYDLYGVGRRDELRLLWKTWATGASGSAVLPRALVVTAVGRARALHRLLAHGQSPEPLVLGERRTFGVELLPGSGCRAFGGRLWIGGRTLGSADQTVDLGALAAVLRRLASPERDAGASAIAALSTREAWADAGANAEACTTGVDALRAHRLRSLATEAAVRFVWQTHEGTLVSATLARDRALQTIAELEAFDAVLAQGALEVVR